MTDSLFGAGSGVAGAAGAPGAPGAPGTNGTNGHSVLNGSGAPSAGTGANGDFYIDTVADAIYGPKTAGVWGSGTSLIGATGATGPTGPTGPAGTSAFPADVQVLGSPTGSLPTSPETDILTSTVTIGTNGKLMVLVYFSINAASGHGVNPRIQDTTNTVTLQPKHNVAAIADFGSINQPNSIMGYESGLTPAGSVTVKFQAVSFDSSLGTVQDAVMSVWTW